MTPAKRTEQEIKEMRERILDATIELARREGLEGVSIRNIAERVGVSHMLLYSEAAMTYLTESKCVANEGLAGIDIGRVA